jgi:starch synthase (maltosyl-transferring)
MAVEQTFRVVIEGVSPQIDGGRFPVKRAVGENVRVEADIYCDGHDALAAVLLVRRSTGGKWTEIPMRFMVNDRWWAEFTVGDLGTYQYTLEAWIDSFSGWRRDLRKKLDADQDVSVDLRVGAELIRAAAKRAAGREAEQLTGIAGILEGDADPQRRIGGAFGEALTGLMAAHPDRTRSTRYSKTIAVIADPPRALFSTWYERFPRSCSTEPGRHGTFADLERILPEISRMGFDVLYLPPIHPIGKTNRKGRNNNPRAESGDPGSPWAIGSEAGGHTAVHPRLGTLDDFDRLVRSARASGIEVALDIAFQCSPDHPYVKAHPEWFKWRPDGTVQYAENPPKKYEDILPLNFETDDWRGLWEELRNVVLFWAGRGVRIFRVDNPHTKPLAFWEWMISEVRGRHPDAIFLAEAFTRPKVMNRLAKLGFNQSYTYFTWRNTKYELTAYLSELTGTESREYFRPNFWPNTPDILHEQLQFGGRPAFLMRLVLAATMSSNYGIYGPPFELCLSAARPGFEEYHDNEKYEIKTWDWDRPGNLKDFIARVNRIRKENPALQTTWNLRFCETDNDQLIAYVKTSGENDNIILTVVNLDVTFVQSGWIRVPLDSLGIDPAQSFSVHDLISDERYIWQGERNFVKLDPHRSPAHVFKVHSRILQEKDFDYFM